MMNEERANLLVTSPLYANQRAYTTGGIADWDRLMQVVFTVAMMVMAAAAQMLVVRFIKWATDQAAFLSNFLQRNTTGA